MSSALRRGGHGRIIGILMGMLVSGGVAVYVLWYASAGGFPRFPYVHNDYSDLGEAFLHGQVALLEQPSPELQALKDPYVLWKLVRVPHRWDASYYRGKYYLYWGPVPAVISAGLQLAGGGPPSGTLLCSLAYLSLLASFFGLLILLRNRLFTASASWLLGLFIAVGFVNFPLLFLLGQSRIYEASILYGQAFLFAGLLCWELYRSRPNPAWLVASGTCWTLAMGSRYNLLISVLVFVAFAIHWICRRQEGQRRSRIARLIGPIILGLAVAAIYNYVRFDNVFETGKRFQLTASAAEGAEYSLAYLPSSLYIYLLYPLSTTIRFPFVRSALFDPDLVPAPVPVTRAFDHVVFGTIPAAPVLVLFLLWIILLARGRRAPSQPESQHAGNMEWRSSLGMYGMGALAQFLFVATYYYGAERFVGDFYLLTVLTVALIVLRVDDLVRQHIGLRAGLWLLTVGLAIWTVGIGFFGAFSVPPKTFSLENPNLYAQIASYCNDRYDTLQVVMQRLGLFLGVR